MNHLRASGAVLSLALLAGLLQPGCKKPADAPGPGAPPWFADVTDEVGLHFVHDAGPVTEDYPMPQIVGSGAALFDFDGDGLLDIYLLQNGGPRGAKNQLFRQLPGGKFQNVSEGSGLDVAGNNMGVAVGDVNNDGRPDVLLTRYGGVRLFRNDGGGKFTDVTREAGIETLLWGTSAAFVDYDRDGWLDLVLVHYVDYTSGWPCSAPNGLRDYCAPKTFKGTVSYLFHNRGKQPGGRVRFEDVSLASGIGRKAGPGLGVVCADFNGDGWPDVFVANDGQPNHLWINRHDGTFTEEAVPRGVAYNSMGQAEANMGIGLGDVDGDGLEDLFVTHLGSETNTLWRQGPRGIFQDRTAFSRLNRPARPATGFGTVLGDFDQDGALDAALVNGAVARLASPSADPALGPHWRMYAERNQLFANDGAGTFRDVSAHNPAFCGHDQVGRGLCMGVLDNERGSLDLLVTSIAGRARLFRNVALGRGHWLLVRAFDPALRRDALGAEITVRAGDRRWVRTAQSGGSFLCSNDPRAHFGLGKTDRIDALEVAWPDGKKEIFDAPEFRAVDRHVQLPRGTGRPAPPPTANPRLP